MPITFSSSSRNSSGGYSYSSGVQTNSNGSPRSSYSSAPAYSGPGSSSFNSYYSPGGGYEQNLNYASSGGGYDGSGSSYVPAQTYTAADGKNYATAGAAEAATREYNLEKAERKEEGRERRQDRSDAALASKGLLASQGLYNEQGNIQQKAPVSQPSNIPFATPAGQYGEGISKTWTGNKSYLNADLSGMKQSLMAAGMSEAEAQKHQDYQMGVQAGYQRQADNRVSLDNYTAYGAKVDNEALAEAGNEYRGVKDRNAPMHEDALAKGLTAMDRNNFAFDNKFAGEYKTGADYAAMVGDAFVPFVSPFQGMVDASQGSDARKSLLGSEMSTADKWRIGLNTAIPFARTIGDMIGPGQYDNYGAAANIQEQIGGSDSVPQQILNELESKGIDPDSEEGKEAIKQYGLRAQGGRKNATYGRQRMGRGQY